MTREIFRALHEKVDKSIGSECYSRLTVGTKIFYRLRNPFIGRSRPCMALRKAAGYPYLCLNPNFISNHTIDRTLISRRASRFPTNCDALHGCSSAEPCFVGPLVLCTPGEARSCGRLAPNSARTVTSTRALISGRPGTFDVRMSFTSPTEPTSTTRTRSFSARMSCCRKKRFSAEPATPTTPRVFR